MKNKNNNSFFRWFFSLIITPFIGFFLVSALMIMYVNKNPKLFGLWLINKNNFFKDVKIFYERNDKYSWLAILILVGLVLLSILVLNYKDIWNKLKKHSNKVEDKEAWEYNELTNEGLNKKAFVNKFTKNCASWTFGYFGKKDKYLVPPKNDLHSCVLGISGSGKSEKIILPNIHYNANLSYEEKPNFVITDPKGEILARTGNFLKENDYQILVFDLDNAKKSIKWNPLKVVWDFLHNKSKEELNKYDYANAYQAINEVVNSLKWGGGKEEGSIWEENAKNVIITVLKFWLLYSLEDKTFTLKYFNLANVLNYLDIESFQSGKWVDIIKKNKELDAFWFSFYKEAISLIDTTKETLSGFLTNAKKVINQFNNDLNVNEITVNDNFEIKDLIKNNKPIAIFIKFPDHKKSCQFLISILVSQIYKAAIDIANENKSRKLDRKLLFMLEEFNSIERINDFAGWLSISRSRGIHFLVVLQDYEQLKKYDTGKNEHKQIKSQFGLTYFLETGNEETLESFSKMLGDKKVEKTSKTKNGDGKESTSTNEQNEPVMSMAELKQKDQKYAITLCSRVKPMLYEPTPAWKYFKELGIKEFVYDFEEEIPNDDIVWDFKLMKEINLNKSNKNILEDIEIAERAISETEEERYAAKSFTKKEYSTMNRFRNAKINRRDEE